jgi:hypothetical protein
MRAGGQVAARARVRGFCEFLYEVPVGSTFTHRNLQGALRVHNSPGTLTCEQTFNEYLPTAIKHGWIRPNTDPAKQHPEDGDAGMIVYERIGLKKSALARAELQVLKDRIICEMEGREWEP